MAIISGRQCGLHTSSSSLWGQAAATELLYHATVTKKRLNDTRELRAHSDRRGEADVKRMEHIPMTTALQEPLYASLEHSGNYTYHLFRHQTIMPLARTLYLCVLNDRYSKKPLQRKHR